MTNSELCMALMRADSEDEVEQVLQAAGYWGDRSLWRYLGDNENNYGPIGNQQSEPVAALTEKLINGVDARLMLASQLASVEPEGPDAPGSIKAAVARFFEGKDGPLSEDAGVIALWPDSKMTPEAELLTLTATGYGPKTKSGRMCLTIADAGEGQTPDMFPDTFLSLQKSNKLRVPFVQGKFNMGATGALRFCSPEHRLQLIVSRRHPDLADKQDPRSSQWGFTIVRREVPADGARNSVFTYLAPIDVQAGRDGRVLSFDADTWPVFPRADAEVRDAYARDAESGSLVKLYEYGLDGTKSNIVRSGGNLLQRVDFALPELALPIRLYECRSSYSGHGGSFATNVLGVVARLERDRYEKLENGFPIGHLMRLASREVRMRVYALKDSAKEYRSGTSAIVFTINGQTHGTKSLDLFRRSKSVGLSQLADSLIVVVDCSDIEGRLREDMFLNSRDRLSSTPTTKQLEAGLETFLKNDPTLRALKNRRREQEIKDRLDDAKPLADALSELIDHTPGLSSLLGAGPSIPSPFPKAGTGDGTGSTTFEGKRFPTFFRFRKQTEGKVYERKAHLESHARLQFETDAVDDYFHRDSERGAVEVDLFDPDEDHWKPLNDLSFTGPKSGVASLTFELPDEVITGDVVRVRVRVTDPSRLDAFEMEAALEVAPPMKKGSGGSGRDSNKNKGGDGQEGPGPVALPNIWQVYEQDWGTHDFDELSAIKAIGQGEGESGHEVYDFYVNCSNKYLLASQKSPKSDPEVLRGQFVYALVLFSMALLIKQKTTAKRSTGPDQNDGNIEDLIRQISEALAPFVLPTLEAMGTLAEEGS